jgi:hypothetical protein
VTWQRPSLGACGFAAGNLVLAALVLGGVFGALPVRFIAVDAGAVLLGALLVASTVALIAGARWTVAVVRAAAWAVLGLGLGLTAALVLGAACVRGVTGDLGVRGLAVLLVALALELPYLVLYPALALRCFGRPPKSA